MIYRKAEEKDLQEILELTKSHDLPAILPAVCFVAEHEGKIIGYINGGFIGYVESMVSNNPMATVKLLSMMEGVLQNNGIKPILASVTNPKAGTLLEGFGYKEVQNTKFFLRSK